jgi:hypothetical protein
MRIKQGQLQISLIKLPACYCSAMQEDFKPHASPLILRRGHGGKRTCKKQLLLLLWRQATGRFSLIFPARGYSRLHVFHNSIIVGTCRRGGSSTQMLHWLCQQPMLLSSLSCHILHRLPQCHDEAVMLHSKQPRQPLVQLPLPLPRTELLHCILNLPHQVVVTGDEALMLEAAQLCMLAWEWCCMYSSCMSFREFAVNALATLLRMNCDCIPKRKLRKLRKRAMDWEDHNSS